VHPDDLALVRQAILQASTGDTDALFEHRIIRPDGSIRYVEEQIKQVFDEKHYHIRNIGTVQDITDRKLTEEKLRKALDEKTTLIRELYHRTKNNMALIIALLELQAGTFSDIHLKRAFADATTRVRSMALVHQKLYEAQDLSYINLKDYIVDLISLVMTSFNFSSAPVSLILDLEDVFILIDTAIPCGLILNELATNTFKHAFSKGANYEVRISLHRSGDGEIQLSFSDNGKGVPSEFDFRRDGHLGIQTVFLLAENQLQGQIEFEQQQGIACQMKFRDNHYRPRV
jgi:two-component sensor histidine kinase